MSDITESLLDCYLRFVTAISNERVSSELPFNEALICNLLYRKAPGQFTATELCEHTRIQKSQMARTLNQMEEKGLILRCRSREDRRRVLVILDKDRAEVFFRQHARSLEVVRAIEERLAPEKTRALIALLNEASDAAREVLG